MNENEKQEQTPNQDNYRVFHWPKWRTWGRIFLVWFVVFIVGDLYLHIWVHGWIKEKIANDEIFSPKNIAGIKAFWDKTLDFPEEWVKEKPASQEFFDANKKADLVWEEVRSQEPILRAKLGKWARLNNLVFQGDEEKEFLSDVKKMEPFIKASLDLSTVMKKEAEMGASCFDFPDLPFQKWELDDKTNAILLKARVYVLQGQFGEAFESYTAIMPMMIAHPAKDFFYRILSIRYLEKVILEIESLIVNINNPDEMRDGLDTLNWIDPFLFTNMEERSAEFRLLSELNGLRSTFDLTPGKKAEEYIQQYADLIFSQYSFSYCLNNIMWDFLSKSRRDEQIKEQMIVELVQPFVFSPSLNEYKLLYASYALGMNWGVQSEKRLKLSFDTLRLQLAARLYEMETGPKVTATTDLVPKYISEELVTPESENPYQWDSEGKLIVPFFQ